MNVELTRNGYQIVDDSGTPCLAGTREEYEATCTALSIAPDSDQEIRSNSYAYTYGDVDMIPASERPAFLAGRQRFRVLKSQEKRPARPEKEDEVSSCPNCRMLVYRSNLMAASLGTGCPHCFDQLSD